MATETRVPPGRAGRIWLRRRLGEVERGRDQLERKIQILLPERRRLRLHVARLRHEWETLCREALTWHLRLVVLGGEDALRSALPPQAVGVRIDWTTAMGLTYPTGVEMVRGPAPAGWTGPPLGNAAVVPATDAFREALRAGAQLAAAESALRRVEAETAVTRRRLRALETRRLPAMREALHSLELTLEQEEQEEHTRVRRAVRGPMQGGHGP